MEYMLKNIIVGVFLFGIIVAQTPQQIDLLLERNREIRSAKNNYLSATERIKTVGALPDPRFESSFSINSIETKNGPINNQLMLAQGIPFWGKRKLMKNIESANSNIAKYNLSDVEINMVFKLRKILAEFNKVNNSMAILTEFKVELESFLRSAESQYANGMGVTRNPIIKLQIELTKVASEILNLESKSANIISELTALYDGELPNNLFDTELIDMPSNLDEKYWISTAMEKSPKLKLSNSKVYKSQIGKKYSKRRKLPDITAGITYSIIGDNELSNNPTAGDDALGLKLGINLPIWFGKNKARVQSATYKILQTEDEKINLTNKIESETKSLLSNIKSTNETFQLYNTSILVEVDLLKSSSLSAYENGSIRFLDLLDSYRMGVSAQIELESIVAKRTNLFAKLYQIVGLIYPEGVNYEN